MRKRTLKEKIRRLEEELEIEKKRNEELVQDKALLRTRCLIGVERYFDSGNYDLLCIGTNRHIL